MTAVITKLILECEIHPLKTDVLLKIYNELNHIGNNINQLARKANAGFASRDEITRALRMLDRVYELMYQLSQQSWQ